MYTNKYKNIPIQKIKFNGSIKLMVRTYSLKNLRIFQGELREIKPYRERDIREINAKREREGREEIEKQGEAVKGGREIKEENSERREREDRVREKNKERVRLKTKSSDI